ncbi:SIR2 family NAD-dependent protein deacylase [Roseivirga pacifica]
MQKLVVLTGAGISAESGLKTFRDSNGLWEGHDVMEVASPEGWHVNPSLVLHFYNERRKQALSAQPNRAHLALAALEQDFEITIITQNVDHLHEDAGSSHVIHLHGKLFESRSTADENLVYQMDGWELNLGDLCEKGSQLRPNIVWFGEAVPMMEEAIHFAQQADIFLVVGTSLQVYPAAGLVQYTPYNCPVYIIDPSRPATTNSDNFYFIEEKATTGMEKFKELIKK